MSNNNTYNPCRNTSPKKQIDYYKTLWKYAYNLDYNFNWDEGVKKRGWYKFSDDYLEDVKFSYKPEKLDIYFVSVWLFRYKLWTFNTDIDSIISEFIRMFHITDEELNFIFTRHDHDKILFSKSYYQALTDTNTNFNILINVGLDVNSPTGVERKSYVESRIIRDTLLSRSVKLIYDFKCQICGKGLIFQNGKKYAESHHIKPLGKPHNGPDILGNIICVCPNHHVLLDYGGMELNIHNLISSPKHKISEEFIVYHNEFIYSGT